MLRHHTRLGHFAALIIQKHYRGYLIRYIYKYLYIMQRTIIIKERYYNALLLQTVIRRYFDRKYVNIRRKLYQFVVYAIQRVTRGFLCRRRLLKDRMSRRIQGFLRMVHYTRCRSTVILLAKMRRLMSLKANAVIVIQCAFRQYQARMILLEIKRTRLMWNHAAFVIQKKYRDFKELMQALQRFYHERTQSIASPRPEDYARVAMLVHALFSRYRRRKKYWLLLNRCAIVPQRLVRGFLGRVVTRQLLRVRAHLRSWVSPAYACNFMQRFLENKVMSVNLSDVKRAAVVADKEIKRMELEYQQRLLLQNQTNGGSSKTRRSVVSSSSRRPTTLKSRGRITSSYRHTPSPKLLSHPSTATISSLSSTKPLPLLNDILIKNENSTGQNLSSSTSASSLLGLPSSRLPTSEHPIIPNNSINTPSLTLKSLSKQYVRQYLPDKFIGDHEVSQGVFLVALAKWYQSVDAPLLEQEGQIIMLRFRNNLVSSNNLI